MRFPRFWRRDEAERERAPGRAGAPCPICGALAPAGYVVATAQQTVNLGWVTGEPGVQQWGDVLLDSRSFDKPARCPGHMCPECGLIWLEPLVLPA